MAHLKTVLLSKSEEDLIHDKSIECLQDVGIRVDSESVLELLEEEGASVDYENHLAKIPVKMVNQALETAPKEFTLCGRDPKHDLEIPTKKLSAMPPRMGFLPSSMIMKLESIAIPPEKILQVLQGLEMHLIQLIFFGHRCRQPMFRPFLMGPIHYGRPCKILPNMFRVLLCKVQKLPEYRLSWLLFLQGEKRN